MSGSEGRLSGLALDPEVVAVAGGGAAADGRAHRGGGHRRGARLRRPVQRAAGPEHRESRAERAGGVPASGDPCGEHRLRAVAVAGPRRRLRTRPRRGPQRPLDRRPALGVPGRRQGGLARVVRDRRQRRAGSQDRRPVRRAGVRVHRRTVGLQRVRTCRRTGHRRAGPAALSRCSHRPASRRRAGRGAAGECGARELACPADPYRGVAARRPQPRTGAPVRRRSPAGHRGPAGPGSRGVVVGHARPRHGRWRDGRCCCPRWRAATLSSAPRALGFWSGPPTSGRSAPATCGPRARLSSTPTSIWSRSSWVPTRMPPTTCGSVRWPRCTGCAPTPPSASRRRCGHGCCTRGSARPSRQTSSSTRRPCATG